MPDGSQPILFGEWLPDQRYLGNPGVIGAVNAIATATGYRSFPGLGVFSNALDNPCRGAIRGRTPTRVIHVYAGDKSKLYAYDSAAFRDASKSGGYAVPDQEFWGFTVFNGNVIACHINDQIQALAVGGAGLFANQPTTTLTPAARHITSTEQFPIIGNLEEDGTRYPYRVRWPSITDETDWDQNAANQSDSEDLDENHGEIQALVGVGRDAYIFQQRGISVLTYEGGQTIFRVDLAEQNRGAVAARSVVAYGRNAFYRSDDGFYRFDGAQSEPIGREKVDQWFLKMVNQSLQAEIVATISPRDSLVCWAFPLAGAQTSGVILCYNWVIKRWSYALVDTQYLLNDETKGFTLEQLDTVNASLDALPFSLDSSAWSGGLSIMSAFDSSNKLGSFDGSALAAVIDTAEQYPTPGRLSRVQELRPLLDTEDGTVVTMQVLHRDTLQESRTLTTPASGLNSIGVTDDIDVAARFLTYRMNVPGAFRHAIGVEHDPIPWGKQ